MDCRARIGGGLRNRTRQRAGADTRIGDTSGAWRSNSGHTEQAVLCLGGGCQGLLGVGKREEGMLR